MMRTALTIAVAVLLALPLGTLNAWSSQYPCFHASAAPAVDGDASDPCWSATPLATGFSILGNGFTDAKQTAFRLCWDDAALYVLVVCEEPDVARLKTDVRDGGEAWLNDGVEVFVQPASGGQVYQLGVTAAAARSAGEGAPDWRQVEAAAATGQASYTLEIAIPHGVVRAEPRVGVSWHGAICRNIWTTNSGGDKFTSWPALQRRFLEPEHFATIDFRGAAPSEQAVAAMTLERNRGYREHLVAQLRGLTEQAPHYLPGLEQARESEELGGRARSLLYRWYRLARMQAASERFSIQQLRETVQSAEALQAASYDVKYAHLIDGLFPD